LPLSSQVPAQDAEQSELGLPSTSWHGAPQQVESSSQGLESSHEVPSEQVPLPPEPVEQLPLSSQVPEQLSEQSELGLPSTS
jgi:hypothetical protein